MLSAYLVLDSWVILMLGEVDLRIRGRSSGSWRNIFRSEMASRASLSELKVLAASVIFGIKTSCQIIDLLGLLLGLQTNL